MKEKRRPETDWKGPSTESAFQDLKVQRSVGLQPIGGGPALPTGESITGKICEQVGAVYDVVPSTASSARSWALPGLAAGDAVDAFGAGDVAGKPRNDRLWRFIENGFSQERRGAGGTPVMES